MRHLGIGTRAIHAGTPDDPHGAVVGPIYTSTTYRLGSAERGAALFAGREQGYIYTRLANPTIDELEAKVAALEGGEAALACASGMAAITAAIFSVAGQGDHIVALREIYAGTTYLFNRILSNLGIEVTYVSGGAGAPDAIRAAIRDNTKVIYIDTPGNPVLTVTDIAAVAEVAHSAGALLFCDNTFATPINQRPLSLGADVVLHAATKYLGGHGDAMGGIIVGPAEMLHRAEHVVLRDTGGVLGPFEAYLITRGIKTLHLRVARHNENAMSVARFLDAHARVERVMYPGLPSFIGCEIAQRQMSGFGGIVCVELCGGLEAASRFLDALKLCILATSLGDVMTLIVHPATTGDAHRSPEERRAAGVTDGLIRISVGCEDPDDIIADLDQALSST
jgi:methionine-gamma-lyase